VFTGRYDEMSMGQLISEVKYISAMIGSEFTAVANLMYMYRNLLNLSGYVNRVGTLFDVLKDVRSKKQASNGKMESLDHIKFENATIRTPGEDGVILAKDLNFEVVQGKNTIITGRI
jgi:ABC-type uncharacterized transport system fused permease/ATPase subunit